MTGKGLVPRDPLDICELHLGIVSIHRFNLVSRGSAQHSEDLDELLDAVLSREQRTAHDEFSSHTAQGPGIDLGGVICGSENEFGGTVVPGTNVGHIGFARNELLGGAKVT